MNFRKLSSVVAGVAALTLVLSACGSSDADDASSSVTSAGAGAGGAASEAMTDASEGMTEAMTDASDGMTEAMTDASEAMTDATSEAGGAGSSAATGDSALLDKAAGGSLVIGIKFDQPGLGLKNPDGTFSGFDVEVAKYVAKKLGVEESGIEFKETKSAEREDAIANGTVDFIVATYSITEKRQAVINFAGPYFVAHQDLLVKADNTDITGPETMAGKILCSVAGSTPAQKVKDTYAADVALQEFGTYTECVEALNNGVVDAVTTDDVILAGYAAQYPGELKLVGKGFSDENYGIGLKKGDTAATDAINTAIQDMIDDGSWAAALESTVGPSGYVIPEPPTVG